MRSSHLMFFSEFMLSPFLKLILGCFLISLFVLSPALIQAENDLALDVESVHKSFEKYCGDCHGRYVDVEGDVNLLQMANTGLRKEAELLTTLIRVLDQKEMPPEGEEQPPAELRSQLLNQLRHWRDESVAELTDLPSTPIRRMNRFQYNNAVIDLFDLNCIVFTLPERMMREHNNYFQPETGKMANVVTVGSRPLGKSQMIEKRLAGVAAFPQDLRAEHGYDNQADHLSLSPLLMESFLKLGQSITNSSDFVPRNVGIWKEFFQAPKTEENLSQVIKTRLETFLSHAFRSPVDEGTLNRYTSYAVRKIDQGADFTNVMKQVAAAVIASPRFLYLYNTDDSMTDASEISETELASRLSFFLWGSIPDAELLKLAQQGQLSQPDILSAQVFRMLKDQKLKRFCDSFPAQWLQLDRIISSVPDRQTYPEFYFSKYRDSMHMMLEPLLLFETILIEDLPITQLIQSDFTYRSGLLEDAYADLRTAASKKRKNDGGVTVLKFHRVPIDDQRTGGVITTAAVMTMTSGPLRTQPITRGAWIASVIFNSPPKPPPADVPPLAEKPSQGEEHLTLRERLTLHRQRADCKGCHEQIDPLGFALEHFSPIGKWRTHYDNGREIDAGGQLFRKHEFLDVIEFKQAILEEKDRFTKAFAGHLLAYALARELEPSDEPALEKMAGTVAADGYKMQTLIRELVLSRPFRQASGSEPLNELSVSQRDKE